MRQISAPSETLKQVQSQILHCWFERIPLSPFAHGFAPGRSTVTHARVHVSSAKALVGIDLLNAFPSVPQNRVYQTIEWRLGPLLKLDFPLLSQSERRELHQCITVLCTRNGALPQGAPTSGYLLNLVCARLDRKIFGLAMRSGLPQVRYSRYADDLTLTSSASIPPDFLMMMQRLVLESGFRVNPSKIEHYHEREHSLVICGIRLHQGQLALPQKTLKQYRAFFHQVACLKPEEIDEQKRSQVLGKLSYLRYIYPSCPTPLRKSLNLLLERHGQWFKIPKYRDPKSTYRSFTYDELNASSLNKV